MKTAGIDVSHKTVTLAINRAGRIGTPREFKNTAQGHLALGGVLEVVGFSDPPRAVDC